MQNDLISRKKLITAIKRQPSKMIDGKQYIRLDAVLEKVRMSPAIDAVPVVRCKECKHRGSSYSCPMRKLVIPGNGPGSYEDCTEDDGFCHLGEKKDGGSDHA